MILFQLTTTIVGCAALTLSLSLFVYFIRARQAIGRAVAFMLAGESFGLFVAVLFSLTSNGVFDFIGPAPNAIARISVFVIAAASSIHLAYQTRKIQLKWSEED